MKRIIDGKIYNTETATLIADISPRYESRNDFNWEDTKLYRTRKGQWFLAGEGGARSRWSHPIGNGSTAGDGLELVQEYEAQQLVGQHAPEKYTEFFGEPEEG
jgi:hypothetical protein